MKVGHIFYARSVVNLCTFLRAPMVYNKIQGDLPAKAITLVTNRGH